MATGTMQGVYPILVTPFHDDGRIDAASLRRLIDFNLDAGVHGLGVALGSEIFKLAEAERDQVIQVVVDQVKGRVPVVINTGAPGTDLAVFYSRRAEELGADALMIMPPAFMPAGAEEVLDYFTQISAAVHIPIFLQDTPTAPISPGLARQLAERCEWVRYIKVESLPITAKVAAMVDQAGEQLVVFGGAGGGYFIEELRRGAVGTMPFCTQPEAFVGIWHAVQAGDEAAAFDLFNRYIQPVARLAGQGVGIFYAVHKAILRHRGVIASDKVRSPAPALDPLTRTELDQLLATLYPNG